MTVNDAPRHQDMIVVGDVRRWCADGAASLAAEFGLAVVRCGDVYRAVTVLARRRAGSYVVIGPLRDLVRERGSFLALAERHGARCGCLLDERDLVHGDRIRAAVRAGAAVVAAAPQLRVLLEQWLAQPRPGPDRRWADRRLKEEFQATEAELKALLGQEDDE
jgi:hypothetical protein